MRISLVPEHLLDICWNQIHDSVDKVPLQIYLDKVFVTELSQYIMTNLNGNPPYEPVNISTDYENEGFFNYEGDIDNLRHPWIREAHFIPTVTVFASTFLLGIVGNSLVVFALVGDKKRRNVTSSFLVSLACADILFLVICVPYEIVRYFIGPWSIGPSLCKLSGSVEMLSAVASIMNLTAISVERYVLLFRRVAFNNRLYKSYILSAFVDIWVRRIGEGPFLVKFERGGFHRVYKNKSNLFEIKDKLKMRGFVSSSLVF